MHALGDDVDSMMCLTMSSLGMLSALATFSLVEKMFPAAFPPFRSSNTTVAA